MTAKSKIFSKLRPYLIGIALVALLWFALMETGILPAPNSTITQTELRVHDLSGHDYEVTYANSDGLSKDETVSVYASKARQNGRLPFTAWFRKKTLIFEYDPGMSTKPPSIVAVGTNSIRISIPRVSSIIYQTNYWDGTSIQYQIGQVDYK